MECENKTETKASGSKNIAEKMASGSKDNAETMATESENKVVSERLSNYFRNAANTTLDKFLSSFSYNMFKVCYPEVHIKNPSHLKDIHQQLKTQLKTSITEDLSYLCKERKVFPALLTLDAVINQYKDKVKEQSWRPNEIPEDNIRDHIYELKLKHKKRIQELLDQLKADNKQLEDTMLENSKVIMNIKKEIDDQNSQINYHFEGLDDSGIDKLEKEFQIISDEE